MSDDILPVASVAQRPDRPVTVESLKECYWWHSGTVDIRNRKRNCLTIEHTCVEHKSLQKIKHAEYGPGGYLETFLRVDNARCETIEEAVLLLNHNYGFKEEEI